MVNVDVIQYPGLVQLKTPPGSPAVLRPRVTVVTHPDIHPTQCVGLDFITFTLTHVLSIISIIRHI